MPPSASVEHAVSVYLQALKDPNSLRDDDSITSLEQQLESSPDSLERLRLRQQLLDAQTPSVERYEEGFVTHAKAWADDHEITAKAFAEEGVSAAVLRRAGFDVPGAGGARGRRGASGAGTGRKRTRVTVSEVRDAIPKGTFTIKTLQDLSGASPAVVRKVVSEEMSAGRLKDEGTDQSHRGPGRAPVLYRAG